MAIQLPQEFVESYRGFRKYPFSLQSPAIYGRALLGYYERLRRRPTLFSQKQEDFVIPLRWVDRVSNGQFQVYKRNLINEELLRQWLGETLEKAPHNSPKLVGALTPNRDPACLFLFLISESELAPLKTNRDCLLRILTYFQVMPQYIDFLLVYGAREEDRELRFCGFRTQLTCVNPDNGQIIPDLNRSGRRYEVCYNLKGVSSKEASPDQLVKERWKIRQYAIYHRFDLGTGSSLWIVGDPREAASKVIQEVLREGTTPADFQFDTMPQSFKSSLDTHLTLVQWTTEEWRWYIQSLEETIDELTRPALLLDDRGPYHERLVPRAATRVQEYEDKVNEAIMVMESNNNNLQSLSDSYKSLVSETYFPENDRSACIHAVQKFSIVIPESIYDLKMQIARAKVLSKFTADRKGIVVQQLQTQAALKQEALASSMWEFTEKGQKEAIAMRVVTVITLIYLPPTFVSTFFSTDVIKYQDSGGFSMEALRSFLFVTLPLSFVTAVFAFGFYKRESRKRGERARQFVEKYQSSGKLEGLGDYATCDY